MGRGIDGDDVAKDLEEVPKLSKSPKIERKRARACQIGLEEALKDEAWVS